MNIHAFKQRIREAKQFIRNERKKPRPNRIKINRTIDGISNLRYKIHKMKKLQEK